MARYKLRIPDEGTFLYGDDPTPSVVASSAAEARDLLEVNEVHAYIGWCHVLYARDIENGDAFDGAEAGDTMVEYLSYVDRDLADNEILVWQPGPPSLQGWTYGPRKFEDVVLRDVPAGTRFSLTRGGEWLTLEEVRYLVRTVRIDVTGETGERRIVILPRGSSLYFEPTVNNYQPELTYSLKIQGLESALGTEDEIRWLLGWAAEAYVEAWRRGDEAGFFVGVPASRGKGEETGQ